MADPSPGSSDGRDAGASDARRHSLTRRVLPWVVTLGIFALIFSSIDRDLFWANLLDADPVALAAGLLMFFPIISGSVERWRWMLHDHADLPFWTGVKIFLAATSLNSVVPSKLGDLGKAVFLHNQGITDLERASNSVLLEKILDLAGMGTRDAALVALFLPWVPPSTMVGVGLLVSTRYWIPSAFGVFLLPAFLRSKAD